MRGNDCMQLLLVPLGLFLWGPLLIRTCYMIGELVFGFCALNAPRFPLKLCWKNVEKVGVCGLTSSENAPFFLTFATIWLSPFCLSMIWTGLVIIHQISLSDFRKKSERLHMVKKWAERISKLYINKDLKLCWAVEDETTLKLRDETSNCAMWVEVRSELLSHRYKPVFTFN